MVALLLISCSHPDGAVTELPSISLGPSSDPGRGVLGRKPVDGGVLVGFRDDSVLFVSDSGQLELRTSADWRGSDVPISACSSQSVGTKQSGPRLVVEVSGATYQVALDEEEEFLPVARVSPAGGRVAVVTRSGRTPLTDLPGKLFPFGNTGRLEGPRSVRVLSLDTGDVERFDLPSSQHDFESCWAAERQLVLYASGTSDVWLLEVRS
jgi:hypothetical protein